MQTAKLILKDDFEKYVQGPFRLLYDVKSSKISTALSHPFPPDNNAFDLPGFAPRICAFLEYGVLTRRGHGGSGEDPTPRTSINTLRIWRIQMTSIAGAELRKTMSREDVLNIMGGRQFDDDDESLVTILLRHCRWLIRK